VGDLDRNKKVTVQYWQASVIITVHSNNHQPVANATVYGTWSRGYNGSASCVTNSTGTCIIKTGTMRSGSIVVFTVKSVTFSTVPYLPAYNHDPEKESTGTSISISR
jgi:hypothetical protein